MKWLQCSMKYFMGLVEFNFGICFIVEGLKNASSAARNNSPYDESRSIWYLVLPHTSSISQKVCVPQHVTCRMGDGKETIFLFSNITQTFPKCSWGQTSRSVHYWNVFTSLCKGFFTALLENSLFTGELNWQADDYPGSLHIWDLQVPKTGRRNQVVWI